MKTVLNYSHPLSPKAKGQLQAIIGDFKEYVVPFQLDLTRHSLINQVADIVIGQAPLDDNGDPVYPQGADYIVPPALSVAAAVLAYEHLSQVYATRPLFIWLRRAEGIGNVFELGGIE